MVNTPQIFAQRTICCCDYTTVLAAGQRIFACKPVFAAGVEKRLAIGAAVWYYCLRSYDYSEDIPLFMERNFVK
jgi:hypothetical protein